MNDPYTNQPVALEGDTYTVVALRGWTNQAARTEHYVPAEGLPILAEQMLFEAWDAQGGPQTCVVVAVPSEWPNLAQEDAFIRAYDEVDRRTGYPEEFNWDEEVDEYGLTIPGAWYKVSVNEHYAEEVDRFWSEVDRLVDLYLAGAQTQWWQDATGRWSRRTVGKSEKAQMLRFARVVDSYIAQADGAPTPIGVNTAAERPTDYDILTYDDMVPWDGDAVGDLGTGPGVPST